MSRSSMGAGSSDFGFLGGPRMSSGDLGKGLTAPTLGLREMKALTLGTQKTRGWGLALGPQKN